MKPNPRILIYESKDYSSKLLQTYFEDAGGIVSVASGLDDFSCRLSQQESEILVIDFPRNGDVELAISCDLSKYYVIATTADDQISKESLERKIHIDVLLLKPIKRAAFLHAINAAIKAVLFE